jgi:hypothetical protein
MKNIKKTLAVAGAAAALAVSFGGVASAADNAASVAGVASPRSFHISAPFTSRGDCAVAAGVAALQGKKPTNCGLDSWGRFWNYWSY